MNEIYDWHRAVRIQKRRLGLNNNQIAQRAKCSYCSVSAALYGGSIRTVSLKRVLDAIGMEVRFIDKNKEEQNLVLTYTAQNFTLAKMVKATGLSTSCVFNAINGKSATTYTIETIAKALGLTMVVVSKKTRVKKLFTKEDWAEEYSSREYEQKTFIDGWNCASSHFLIQVTNWLDEQLSENNLEGCRDYEALIESLNSVFTE